MREGEVGEEDGRSSEKTAKGGDLWPCGEEMLGDEPEEERTCRLPEWLR